MSDASRLKHLEIHRQKFTSYAGIIRLGMQNPLRSLHDTRKRWTKYSVAMKSWKRSLLLQPNLQFAERNRSETLIIIEVHLNFMNPTCIHDLKPNRVVTALEGRIARSYPMAMKFARGRWIPFRPIILTDASGWILVKIWGSIAINLLRNQQIRLEKAYCFEQNGSLCITLGSSAQLKICTQA